MTPHQRVINRVFQGCHFLLFALVFLSPHLMPSAPHAIPLSGESISERDSKSVADSNSIVEMFERLFQEHRQLQTLRAERAVLQPEIEKEQNEVDDLMARVQATPDLNPDGVMNPKRVQVEKKLAASQSKLNASTQKLARVEDEIDDLTQSRNTVALALVRRIVFFLIFAFLFWILARLLKRIPERIVKEEHDRFYINKLITYSARLIVTIIFLYTIFGELGSFSAFLGLTGAGIAIALQDVIVSFVAWFIIIGRRGFSIGDRIEVAGIRGDVVDIGVLRIVVHEVGNWLSNDVPTGRRVFIPNSFVFKNYFFNYTKPQPFINDELKLLLTFESNWEQGVALVQSAAKMVMDQFFARERAGQESIPQNESFSNWGVGVNPSMPSVYTRIADYGVEVRLVYFTRVRDRNQMRDAMNRAILAALAGQADVSLAYPTSRAVSTPPAVKS